MVEYGICRPAQLSAVEPAAVTIAVNNSKHKHIWKHEAPITAAGQRLVASR